MPFNYETLEQFLQQRMVTLWDNIAYPIEYENVNIDTPENAPWVRFTINVIDAENFSLGTRTQIDGFLVLQIFLPLKSGTRQAKIIADLYAAIMENKQLSNGVGNVIFTYANDLTALGDDGNGWYAFNSSVTFQAT